MNGCSLFVNAGCNRCIRLTEREAKMSLHRRYNAHRKSNAWQWIILIVVCFLLCVLFIGGISFARYVGEWNGRLDANVAQWNMKVNGVSLADTAAASKIAVSMVPDPGDGTASSGKIKPGQSGYFDIEIDPEGTQVSFSYAVTLDTRFLPEGMSVTQYSMDGGTNKTDLPADNCVRGNILLSETESGIFTSDHKLAMRFYWTWEDVAFNENGEYKLVVNASVQQYLGETTNGTDTKGVAA